MKYFLDIESILAAGGKVRRLSWPAGTFLTRLRGILLTAKLTKPACEKIGVPEGTNLKQGEKLYVLVENPENNEKGETKEEGELTVTLGYILTIEDKNSQDWEVVPEEETNQE